MSNINLRGHGDVERVSQDSKTLLEILQRQGTNLVIDVLAEHCGQVSLKFSFSQNDRETLADVLSTELREAILERV